MIIYDLGVVVLDIQKRVKKILDNFRDCKDEFGIMDITRFAVLFGFNINESRDLPNDINGKISSANNNKKIILNIYFSKEQKRYTIAYLISSYLIFYNNEIFLGSHVLDNEIDAVASFARILLVPDNKLKACNTRDCEALASYFSVPIEIMELRLKEVFKPNILQRKKD